MSDEPVPGLYDRLVDAALRALLDRLDAERVSTVPLEVREQPLYLARHVQALVARVLGALEGDDVAARREELVRALVDVLAREAPEELRAVMTAVRSPFEVLRQVRYAATGLERVRDLPVPATPLSQSALLTNAPREPAIGSELEKELGSADRVDAIVAFLKWSGVVRLRDALQAVIARGGAVRLLTSTYTGASELRAVRALAEMGVVVRTSYDPRRTRLHAKAWLLHRDSGFSTAFIGSSNLSRSALVDGLEWNVRLSRTEVPEVLKGFEAAFDGYWNDPEFEGFDPACDEDRFRRALVLGRGGSTGGDDERLDAFFELRPWPFQEEILASLKVERLRHGRHRNLVVAATGTGKTVIAAIDYLRMSRTLSRRPRLLFVAHREELLSQARSTYRHVLRDGTFGELLVDGERPAEGAHVFASIQSLARVDLDRTPRGHFEVVVVDEFHHAEAPTYRRLLDHLFPTPEDGADGAELLGLTATPERADGEDVFRYFGGRVAAEIRLWDALARGLLCPFHYFGVHDETDLSDIEWVRGRYESDLLEDRLATRERAALIVEAVRDRVVDPTAMRALGFCASRAHARFMAEVFESAGIRASALLGDDDSATRKRLRRDLAEGRLQALFTVDLFNEGVDIPDVDAVLFLRPTESATIFLQQLGRGLRHAEGKSHLTVLDFVGQHRREYRFDRKLRALLGGTTKELERNLEAGFPNVPPGCSIQLDRVARQLVLDNVRHALPSDRRSLLEELRAAGRDVTFASFLERAGLSLDDLYGSSRSFFALHREAFGGEALTPELRGFSRAMGRLLHVEDPERLEVLHAVASPDGPTLDALTERRRRVWHAVLSVLWPRQPLESYGRAVELIRAAPDLAAELRGLAECLEETVRHDVADWSWLQPVPLTLHARYQRSEVMALFDKQDAKGKLLRTQAGVLYEDSTNADLLFITLEKTEKSFSPTTRYNDYALSADRFHWESQNVAHPRAGAGRRYVAGTSTVLLFVRERRTDGLGRTAPFTFLGPAQLESHESECPMRIVWALEHPMPAWVLTTTRAVS